MGLDRPPRAAAGAVTDRVRSAILAQAKRLGITPELLVGLHARAEFLADLIGIVNDVEERYQLQSGSLLDGVRRRATEWASQGRVSIPPYDVAGESELAQRVLTESGRELVLLELPDAEFLTVLEHVVEGYRDDVNAGMVDELFKYADYALRAHGAPYRRIRGVVRFEWVGDPAQHAVTVQPALLALADSRLAGARAEFEEALAKRRRAAPKDLEDAVDEAAKSVESALKVLHHEHTVAPPKQQQVAALFNSLVSAQVLPGYVDKLIGAAAGPRNHMAGHGQGDKVRQVSAELADASVAAAATAITFLAHYLP